MLVEHNQHNVTLLQAATVNRSAHKAACIAVETHSCVLNFFIQFQTEQKNGFSVTSLLGYYHLRREILS